MKYSCINFLILFGLLLFSGCVDLEFEEPPVDGTDLVETGNTTIAELKAMAREGQLVEISEDIRIQGVVIADDRSGNFFREFVMQDATGGLKVLINLTSLYNFYPVGRELVVKCQGAFLGNGEGVIQLGGYTYIENGVALLGDIIDYDQRIIKGKIIGAPEPVVRSISDLSAADISTLVRVQGVEFVDQDLGLTYADTEGNRSANRFLTNCEGSEEVILRSSGFADFAGETVPAGNGSVTAVYSVFREDAQLFIRTLEDVKLDGHRCSKGGGGAVVTGSEESVAIADLRAIFAAGNTTVAENKKIKGIVVSDGAGGNWSGRNLVLQDESAGIVVRFQDEHSFALNDEVEVVVSGREISDFNGLLQVNEVPNNFAKKLASGQSVTARKVTVKELLDQEELWESTLVEIEAVTISGSTTLEGVTTVSDETGSIPLFTRGSADFANAAVPASALTLVAVLSDFNGSQLMIRNLSDIGGSGATNGGAFDGEPVDKVEESFADLGSNATIAIPGWQNVAIKGQRLWQAKSFDANTYAQATAFGDNNSEMEAWLITPPLDLSGPKILSFESAKAFYVHDGLSVWLSTDYNGEDLGAATWVQLEAVLAGSDSEDHAWISSGEIDLSAFSGIGYIGFKHIGNPDSGTTSYRLDNIKVTNK